MNVKNKYDCQALLENNDNFDLRHGLKVDCNQENSLVRGVRPS